MKQRTEWEHGENVEWKRWDLGEQNNGLREMRGKNEKVVLATNKYCIANKGYVPRRKMIAIAMEMKQTSQFQYKIVWFAN